MQTAAKLVAIVFGSAVLVFFVLAGTGSLGIDTPEPEPHEKAQVQPVQNQPTSSLAASETPAPAAVPEQSTAPATIGEEKHLRLAREGATGKAPPVPRRCALPDFGYSADVSFISLVVAASAYWIQPFEQTVLNSSAEIAPSLLVSTMS
jgi:hypothetical protein